MNLLHNKNFINRPKEKNNSILFLITATWLAVGMNAHASEIIPPSAPEKAEKPVVVPINRGFTGDYLAGLTARSSGDIPNAIRYLRRAYDKHPGNVELISQLQGVLLLDGRVDEAVALAAEADSKIKPDQLSKLLLTLKAIKQNDINQARVRLKEADDDEGVQLWLPLIEAWLDIAEHKLTKPLTLEDISTNIGRAASIAHYHMALINSQAGFKKEAEANFRKAIEDATEPPGRIMEMLLTFYRQNGEPESLRPLVEAYKEAVPDAGNGNTVIDTAQKGVAEVLFTMGSIMLSADINQDAVIYLRMAQYLDPFPAAALALGDAYSDLRQYAKANENYATVSDTSRLYLTAQLHMAVNYDRMNKLPQSLALLDKLAKKMPARYEPSTAKGDLLRMHARFAEAVDAYTLALKRIPEFKPQHWSIIFARGTCYERMGKWDKAEQDLRQALEIKPDQPEVLNYLGYSWLTRNEHLSEAREMLEKAVAKRPEDAQIVDSMGWALYMLGQYNQAVGYIEKAVTLLPNDPTVNDHLGDIYWRQGRKTEARYQWERSLDFAPEAALETSIRKKLKEGLPPTSPMAKGEAPAPVVASQDPDPDAATVR